MKREIKNVCNNYQERLDTADSQTGGLANTTLYVDDCAQTFRSASSSIVFHRLMNSFFLFNKTKERLKLRLSEKEVIVASWPKLATYLIKESNTIYRLTLGTLEFPTLLARAGRTNFLAVVLGTKRVEC